MSDPRTMSEPSPNLDFEGQPGLDTDQRMDALEARLDSWSQEHPDPYIRTFGQVALGRMQHDGELSTILYNVLEDRPELSTDYAARLLLRAIGAIEQTVRPSYPRGYKNPALYEAAFDHVLDISYYYPSFFINMRRNLLSNVTPRARALKGAISLHADKFDGPISVIDGGCSQNKILKKWALSSQPLFAFEPVEVVREEPPIYPSEADEAAAAARPDPELTDRMNRLVRTLLPFRMGIGIDIMNVDDPEIRSFARSCSFEPAELLNSKRVMEYDALDKIWPGHVKFHRDDLARFDGEAYEKRFPKHAKVDVVMLSMMLFQGTPDERTAILAEAERRARHLVVIQDNVDIAADGTMRFPDRWEPYSTGTWVKDMGSDDPTYKKLFSLENGRGDRLKLQPAVSDLQVARYFGLRPSVL